MHLRHQKKKFKYITFLLAIFVLYSCRVDSLLADGPSSESTVKSPSVPSGKTGAEAEPIVNIQVNPDGSFSPPEVTVHPGQTVRWNFSTAGRDSIVPVDGVPTACEQNKAYSKHENNFMGPMPHLVSGIYSRMPDGGGLKESNSTCSDGQVMRTIIDSNGETISQRQFLSTIVDSNGETKVLCQDGEPYASLESTWRNPDIDGIYIHLFWKDIQPESSDTLAEEYKEYLSREFDQAVKYGKFISLGIEAGKHTPEWVNSHKFIDGGSKWHEKFEVNPAPPGATNTVYDNSKISGVNKCGSTFHLGSPADNNYGKAYGNLLNQLADFIKSKNSWYRAFAQIKLGGMNLLTPENRLPKRCDEQLLNPELGMNCKCNTLEWAKARYTPSDLYRFYKRQAERIQSLFPNKDMSYMMIQAGFPKVSDRREDSDGLFYRNIHVNVRGNNTIKRLYKNGIKKDTNRPYYTPKVEEIEEELLNYPAPDGSDKPELFRLPTGTEQTKRILDEGTKAYPKNFIVQHNTLNPATPTADEPCRTDGFREKLNQNNPRQNPPKTGKTCPSHWVNLYGYNGYPTGFQTTNEQRGVANRRDVIATLNTLNDYTNSLYVEFYEERLWESYSQSSNGTPEDTLRYWVKKLHDRRKANFPDIPSVNEKTYSYTFKANGSKDYYYINPFACNQPQATTSLRTPSLPSPTPSPTPTGPVASPAGTAPIKTPPSPTLDETASFRLQATPTLKKKYGVIKLRPR